MKRTSLVLALTLAVIAWSGSALKADVKTQEKGLVTFEGMLGHVVGFFGGKAAKEGVVTTVAVKGDRKLRMTDTTGQIIDLAEEKVYDIDFKKKSYTVTTFAELRRKMQEAEEKARQNASKASGQKEEPKKEEPKKKDPNEKEMEIEVTAKETGQKKAINGFDCREVVTTITMHEKGKTLDQSGGLMMTTDSWLAPRIAAMKEILDFDLRYARKLEGPFSVGASAEDMAAALAMYPMLKQGFAKYQSDVNTDGTAIQTVMTAESVKSQAQMDEEAKNAKQQDDEPSAKGGIGGMIGGFGKKIAKKNSDDQAAAGGPKNRVSIMTMHNEVLKVATDVAAADVAIPAGFKENK